MAGKYANNFIFGDNKNATFPDYRKDVGAEFIRKITQVDSDTIPGATFYNEMMWIMPGFSEKDKSDNPNFWEAHTHDFGELICFHGFNYENIENLGAEIEFTIDGETHIIKESFTAFVPPGVPHGPLTIRNVTHPIAHLIACDTGKYR